MPAPADALIRPMRPGDAADAAEVSRVAFAEMYPEELTPEQEAGRITSGIARTAHLQRTDPNGCWVAEVDGRVVGVALGILREGIWGLSLFVLLPAFQGQ